MAYCADEGKIRAVGIKANEIREAVLRANRTVYRARLASQSDYGTGRVGVADNERGTLTATKFNGPATDLSRMTSREIEQVRGGKLAPPEGLRAWEQRHNRDFTPTAARRQRNGLTSGSELVVCGFWWEGGGTRFVCSQGGMNSVRAIRAKPDGSAVYGRFLHQQCMLNPIDPVPAMTRLEAVLMSHFGVHGQAFKNTEAEAKVTAYLMDNKVEGEVHVYGTHSPCADCCVTLAQLSNAYEAVENAEKNPPAYDKGDWPAFFKKYESSGLGDWRFGGFYYGAEYQSTNFDLLNAAKRGKAIRDYANVAALVRRS